MTRKPPKKARRAVLDRIAQAEMAAVGEAKGHSSAQATSVVMLEGEALREYQERRELRQAIDDLIDDLKALRNNKSRPDQNRRGRGPSPQANEMAEAYGQLLDRGEGKGSRKVVHQAVLVELKIDPSRADFLGYTYRAFCPAADRVDQIRRILQQ